MKEFRWEPSARDYGAKEGCEAKDSGGRLNDCREGMPVMRSRNEWERMRNKMREEIGIKEYIRVDDACVA